MEGTGYTGHGSRTGGLQAHSCGDLMPYMIQAVGRLEKGALRWQVLDSRTGNVGRLHRTRKEAEMEVHSLKLRNMMHG